MVKTFWIARITLDAFEVSVKEKRLGANKKTQSRLKGFLVGDHGIFYISTQKLDSSSRICQFRAPFEVTGEIEEAPIDVPSLPIDKRIEVSRKIKVLDTKKSKEIFDLIPNLGFIQKKDSWGSYLMQAFIKIDENDYKNIVGSLK